MKRLRPALEELERVIQRTSIGGALVSGAEVTIVTHSGAFHCDEVLACCMLKALAKYRDAPIVRTRNEAIIKQGTIAVDVGGTYNAETLRFDHHQRGFTEVMGGEFKTKLSSAGLVYKHFGKEVLEALQPGLSTEHLNVVYAKVYSGFVEHIDGIDNGVEAFEGGVKNYSVSTTLSARVGTFNPQWNDDGDSASGEKHEMERFKQAMLMVAGEFSSYVFGLVESWLPARRIVEAAAAQRNSVHSSGKIVRLERACPWKDHVPSVEAALGLGAWFLYVLYDDGSGVWRVQAVELEGFTSRKALPERLRGLRDAELAQVSGVADAVFVHASGFIGGAKSYQGALKLAELGLQELVA